MYHIKIKGGYQMKMKYEKPSMKIVLLQHRTMLLNVSGVDPNSPFN